MKINIIAAIGQDNEIGLDNKLLWKSKSDLEHFKKLTLGKPIIMGRKTFESLPGILPGRPHFVISSKAASTDHFGGDVWAFKSVKEALECIEVMYPVARHTGGVFIIGGASIFEQAIDLADELHITHMDWTGRADTFFPFIGPDWSASTNDTYNGGDGPDWQYLRYTKTQGKL